MNREINSFSGPFLPMGYFVLIDNNGKEFKAEGVFWEERDDDGDLKEFWGARQTIESTGRPILRTLNDLSKENFTWRHV